MKLIKYLYHVFDDKRYALDDGIHTLSYFHKNSVKSCNNWKNCDYFIDDY